MQEDVKKTTFKMLVDILKIALKAKLGLYAKAPLSAASDAKNLVDDAKQLKQDIKD